MSSKANVKAGTKERILQATLKLLEQSGIQSVSQTAVARALGISQGQLTYHFPKRADLVLAATDLALDRIADFILKKSAALTDKNEKKLLEMVWDLTRDHARIRALLGLFVEADETPGVRERLLVQEERGRMLIALGLGLESNDAAITRIHATLLGFGVLSFLHRENSQALKEDFLAALSGISAELKQKSRAGKSKRKKDT